MFILRFLVRSPQLYILLRSFLRNGSIDFSDFLHEVRDCNGRKATELDFWKKILIWRYSWKGLQISPKLDALVGWLVGNAVFSGIPLRIFLIFCMKLGDYKGRKVTQPDFWKKFLISRYSRKGLQISPKSDALIFFSKTALTIFLVFGLKLVLNMTFNLNETYFSEKFAIWRYLTSKSSKNIPNWGFGHFLDFASLVFLDFAHNDRWAWCLVVFLQFAGPVNVFLLENSKLIQIEYFSLR